MMRFPSKSSKSLSHPKRKRKRKIQQDTITNVLLQPLLTASLFFVLQFCINAADLFFQTFKFGAT